MYIAKVSFTGEVVGTKGRQVAITDKGLIQELLRIGYIEEVANSKPKEAIKLPNEKKSKKKK